MANKGKGDHASADHAAPGRNPQGPQGPRPHDAPERPRNDPGRATDAERRSGGTDDRSRNDPGRAYDAERRSGRDSDPRTNNRPN